MRSNRLVTLVGAGGIGKTRLSIQVAKDLSPEFEDEVAFVELAGLSDGSRLFDHLAECLGLESRREAEEAPDMAALSGALAGAKTLLVLDNCEHIVHAVASLGHHLAERFPLVHILATSRERLGVTGEVLWRVSPLAQPESSNSAEDVLNYPAIQLFMERVRTAEPGFEVSSREDVEAVCTICRRLDGIRLAIELAAARIGTLNLQQIGERLDDRFRLLTRGSRAALPRHQTIKSLIDWSYNLLTPVEQNLLRFLSVFAGGWNLDSAEAMIDRADSARAVAVLDILTSLSDRSLIITESLGREPRFRMLETIREYAREVLQIMGEEDHSRRRHLARMVEVAERSRAGMLGPNTDTALDLLEIESANVRSALAFSLADPAQTDSSLRLAGSL